MAWLSGEEILSCLGRVVKPTKIWVVSQFEFRNYSPRCRSARYSPPWLRRGGRAVKRISPKASADRRGRGVWFKPPLETDALQRPGDGGVCPQIFVPSLLHIPAEKLKH